MLQTVVASAAEVREQATVVSPVGVAGMAPGPVEYAAPALSAVLSLMAGLSVFCNKIDGILRDTCIR
jgi:hypothetical protein